MLVELNISLKARRRADGRFEIRPTIGGKRKSIYGESAEELARKYRAILNDKKPRAERAKSSMTLFQWFEEWTEVYKKPNVAKSTYLNIVRCIDKHLKPKLENKSLARYTMTELTKALNSIESPRMRLYARGVLRDSFSCAVLAGKLSSSPAVNLLPVKHTVKKGKAFALSDLAEMIEGAVEQIPRSMLLYFLFCFFVGARRTEAVNLRFEDCDFKNRIVYIRGTKTVGSNRRVPMFPIVEKILRATGAKKGEKVFKIPLARIDDEFRAFRGEEREGVQHWLRHTFGTLQICMNGIPANTVALWMGHADASTTMDIYTHPEDLAPDIYFSGHYSEGEKLEILKERYNRIISIVEKMLENTTVLTPLF